jgi:uncharacterized membrane protein
MTLSTLGIAHLTSALVALALGAFVLLERKGTPSHRAAGGGYVMAILLVNISALAIYRLTGRFGPFHALALVNLAAVAWGVRTALLRREGWVRAHAACMAWSYVGLLAAAAAEIAVRVPPLATSINSAGRAIALGLALAILFTVLGLVIVPAGLRRGLAAIERTGSPAAGT